MKKLLTLTAIGVILTAPAYAVQKCVALDAENATCIATYENGKADWSVTCTINNISVPIKGIAMCANHKTDAQFGTSYAITMVSSDTDTNNIYCWCKMVEPAVSSWVFISTKISATSCAYDCSRNCASLVRNFDEARVAMFGSLSD